MLWDARENEAMTRNVNGGTSACSISKGRLPQDESRSKGDLGEDVEDGVGPRLIDIGDHPSTLFGLVNITFRSGKILEKHQTRAGAGPCSFDIANHGGRVEAHEPRMRSRGRDTATK